MTILIIFAAIWLAPLAWFVWAVKHAPVGKEVPGVGFIQKGRK